MESKSNINANLNETGSFFQFINAIQWNKHLTFEQWSKNTLRALLSYFQAKDALFYLFNPKKQGFVLKTTYPDSSSLQTILYSSDILIHQILEKKSIVQAPPSAAQNAFTIFLPLFYHEKIHSLICLYVEQNTTGNAFVLLEQIRNTIQIHLNFSLQIEFLHDKVQQLNAINEAMEASQQAMHENAVKFMNIHKKLTDSIQYAKKMQEAILPPEETLTRIFEEHLVIYQPKDIVSGDFYWVSQIDVTFIAVVDCTGHGVPGAFMSMIGNTLLNEIVNIKRISDPSQILTLLHKGVRAALKQRESNNIDGMDICLCRLERTENFDLKLTFSGAKRPLYYIQDQKLQVVKGTRQGIGGLHQTQLSAFENHTLLLKEGDIIYLTTDGVVDTPRPNRKSFGERRLIALLTKYAHLPLVQQKNAFLQELAEYQQGSEQRDDMTMVAIRI